MKKAEIEKLLVVKKSYVTVQMAWEMRYSKAQRNPFVKKCLTDNDPEFENKCVQLAEELKVPVKTVENTVIASILHQHKKYHTVDAPTLFGVFAASLDWADNADKLFEKFLDSDNNRWMSWEHATSREGRRWMKIKALLCLDDEEVQYLDCYQHPWPMICLPNKTTPWSDGHLIAKEIPNSRRSGVNPGCPCYDLDRANRVAFTFDYYLWDNFEYKFSVRKYDGEAKFHQAAAQQQLKLDRLTKIMEEFRLNGVTEFFFTHFYDERLRSYCRGWQANEQGNALDKALLLFAKKEKLTPDGMKGLMIHIANTLNPKVEVNGVKKRLDKFDFETRIQWVKDHDAELEKICKETYIRAEYPKGYQEQYTAEDAYAAFSAIHWLREAQKGNPVPVIVHLDAVNQGIQLQAIITSDDKIMRLSCVIGQIRNDFYIWIAEKLGLSEEERQLIKDGFKPLMYGGSTAVKELWGDELYNKFWDLVYKEHLATFQLVRQFPTQYNTEWTEICWTLPDGGRTRVLPKQKMSYEAEIFGYTFTGTYEKKGVPNDRVCSLGPNIIHSIDGFTKREMSSRCDFDPDTKELIKQYLANPWIEVWDFESRDKDKELKKLLDLGAEFNYYSFHILDLIDAHNISVVPKNILQMFMDELPEKDFQITCIHDSFGCHPNYSFDLMQQYRYCLYHLGMSNILEHIADELNITLDIPHKNVYLMEEILNGKFALC